MTRIHIHSIRILGFLAAVILLGGCEARHRTVAWQPKTQVIAPNGVEMPAYVLYDAQGAPQSYAAMINDLASADVVLFGEQHNNPICHWLQLQVSRDLHAIRGDDLVLGAEMFEADGQLLLDELLAKTIQDKHFEAEGKLWKNYGTDYKPLVAFARDNRLRFVATNIPRRYASLVAREGVDALAALAPEARALICPLPFDVDTELPGYKAMAGMSHGGGSGGNSDAALRMCSAQAVKDATMAHFILARWQRGNCFLHFNGSYHSDRHGDAPYEGIAWYLRQANPELKILTIGSVVQSSVLALEADHLNSADFILCTPADMTPTYENKGFGQ